MWTEDPTREHYNDGKRLQPADCNGTERHANNLALKKIGIWVQGVDRLGAAYEGIWRVIKRFIISSDGTGVQFCLVAPARFQPELEEFLSDLSSDLRRNVDVHAVGRQSDAHDENEGERQAVEANQIDLDAWLVPNPMWAAAKHLVRPKVVWFHDFLLVEFPQSYPRDIFLQFQENIRGLLDAGAFFVFTSPYVKEKHGHEFCGIPKSQSALIINPPIDGGVVLRELPEEPRELAEIVRLELRENLKKWCTPAHADLFFHHISTYPFESVPYYFVSSQNREHKNFLRLAQAHAALVRECYFPYSIFTTALVDVAGRTPLELFLKHELFMGDFLSVGKVSETTHALLYKFARLTIHPSTFEGNLPLPFAESVSVGTPCIMPFSRAYAGYIDASMHRWMFYDATQQAIIEKVADVEVRHQDYVDAQKEVLSKLRLNTLKDFFRLHIDAIASAQSIQPNDVEYLVRGGAEPAPKHPKLLEWIFAHPSHSEAAASNLTAKPMIHARLWGSFELLEFSSGEAADASGLHWAGYLGSGYPKGESYFILRLEGDGLDGEPSDLALFAELGSWIDDEYQPADSCALRFDAMDEIPSELVDAYRQTAGMSANAHFGWAKLGWSRGVSPEIRIGGRIVPAPSIASAKLACLSHGTVKLHRPPEESVSTLG